jgi:hypothetical protein
VQVKIDHEKRPRGSNGTRVGKWKEQSIHRLVVVAYKVSYCPRLH